MKNKTILMVDDTIANLDILGEILVDYDVIDTTTGIEALEILETEQIDLVLLDIMMPEMDGYEVCQRIKQNPRTKEIPIIFITAKTAEEDLEKAYHLGGSDYITKPFKNKEILIRVKTQLKIRSLISHLEYISSHDQLTGVYNRRKFFELAQALWNSSAQDLHTALIDIDKFKTINDQYGHPVGDLVLTKVAQLAEHLMGNHLFARLGGEEFVVLFVNHAQDAIFQQMEQLRTSIAQLEIQTEKGDVVRVTVSTGIAGYKPSHESLDTLLAEADDALYEAKASGRNKVVVKL